MESVPVINAQTCAYNGFQYSQAVCSHLVLYTQYEPYDNQLSRDLTEKWDMEIIRNPHTKEARHILLPHYEVRNMDTSALYAQNDIFRNLAG